MAAIKTFIKKHAILLYFSLTFIFTWGCMVLIVGPGGFPMTAEMAETMGPLVYTGMLVGPITAGLLMTSLVDGKAGFRELLSRLRTWRVGIRWYAVSLLAAPLLATVVLLTLSLFSPAFMPALLAADGKLSLLLTGVMTGLMVGLFEELGWTGFAIPRIRVRYSVLSTGVMVGFLWGAWHFLPFWEGDSFVAALPLALLLARLFSWLPPFRVLMVWVYDRTQSLLVVILMHASLVFTTLTLPSMELTGLQLLTWLLVWAAVLWGAVIVIDKASGKQITQPSIQERAAES
ncbi:MAG: CPBP family intramembrane metalloprotease [Anaerolineae bacterium]|nr:CPBP family intramembrane metalloprotease [Anaerolineae bacterium]